MAQPKRKRGYRKIELKVFGHASAKPLELVLAPEFWAREACQWLAAARPDLSKSVVANVFLRDMNLHPELLGA